MPATRSGGRTRSGERSSDSTQSSPVRIGSLPSSEETPMNKISSTPGVAGAGRVFRNWRTRAG